MATPRPRAVVVENNLVNLPFDSIFPADYTTDGQPQTVVYKKDGTVVATLTVAYSGGIAGGNVVSVERT